jgi:protein gp37
VPDSFIDQVFEEMRARPHMSFQVLTKRPERIVEWWRAYQDRLGVSEWPAERAVPQMSIEFEVADADAVQAAADELEAEGFELLHGARREPWGQTVARLQSIDSVIVGISYAPALH